MSTPLCLPATVLLFFLAAAGVACGSGDAVGEGNDVVARDDIDEPSDADSASSASAAGDGNGPSTGTGGGAAPDPGAGGAGGAGGADTDGSGGAKPNGTGSTNDCCTSSATVGCVDLPTESCVCAIDAYCCTTAWDELCVGVAQNSCNACGGPETMPEPTPDDGDECKECILDQCGLECLVQGCCEDGLHSMVTECLLETCAYECFGWEPDPSDQQGPTCACDVSSGCDGCWCEPASECAADPGCWCDTTWGCDGCDCDPECSPAPDPWLGTCCEASSWETGCDNATIEQCVCGYDSYCCTTAWDAECVGKVEWCGYGACE